MLFRSVFRRHFRPFLNRVEVALVRQLAPLHEARGLVGFVFQTQQQMRPLQLRTPAPAPQPDERVVVHVPGVPGSDPLFEFLGFYGESAELPGDFSVAYAVVALLPGGARELVVPEDGVVEELEVFEVVKCVATSGTSKIQVWVDFFLS